MRRHPMIWGRFLRMMPMSPMLRNCGEGTLYDIEVSLRDRVQCDNGVYTTVLVGILECTQRLSGWNGGAHNCWSMWGVHYIYHIH